MIKTYCMSDIHCRWQYVRDFVLRNKIKEKFTKDTHTLILLGDTGANYFLNDRDAKFKKQLSSLPLTYFIIRGNHEERPSNLASVNPAGWHKEDFWGNKVWVEDEFPNLKYAMDNAAVYEIPYIAGYSEGTEENEWNDEGELIIKTWKTLILPGAYSVDKFYRLMMGYSWFKDEQMSLEEREEAWDIIRDNKYNLDLILSHTCPCVFEPTDLFFSSIDQSTVDKDMERFLGAVEYALENYKAWLWGHFHAFRDYPRTDGRKKLMLFNNYAINLDNYLMFDEVEKL